MFHRALTSFCLSRINGKSASNDNGKHAAKVDAFFVDLAATSHQIGPVTHAVWRGAGIAGYAQLHRRAGEVIIHRLWTVSRGCGNGSLLLRTLCDLADRNRVHLKLKVVPFGEKPFPLTVPQLRSWYHRHDFRGEKYLIRAPSSVIQPTLARG